MIVLRYSPLPVFPSVLLVVLLLVQLIFRYNARMGTSRPTLVQVIVQKLVPVI